MAKTHYEPKTRIHQADLKRETFGSAGIKKSTLRRLNLAKEALYATWEKESYLILERALESYYHNTIVLFHGRDCNLLELINKMDGVAEDSKEGGG